MPSSSENVRRTKKFTQGWNISLALTLKQTWNDQYCYTKAFPGLYAGI